MSGAGKESRRLAAARRSLRPVSLKPVSSVNSWPIAFCIFPHQFKSTRRRAKASIAESELAIRVKFKNGAVSSEKYFAPAAGERDRVAVAIAAGGGVF